MIKPTPYSVFSPMPPQSNHPIDHSARAAIEDTERDHLGEKGTSPAQLIPSGIAEQRIGGWMQTYTGRAVYPMDLSPEDICIEDIAHSLAHQCRYNGHSLRFYSVAEHSVLVARWLRSKGTDAVALEGLLHDATEAYLSDVPRPVKPFLVGYQEAEKRAWYAIAETYNLPYVPHPAVKDADNRILHDERIQNMARSERDWELTGVRLGVTLQFWSPDRAKAEFLAMFGELYGEE